MPAAERMIETLLALGRYGFTPTDMTLPAAQFDELHADLGMLSTAKWGLPHIRFAGPHGSVRIWPEDS